MMEKMEVTYADFNIGDTVVCTNRDDFYEEHLTIGKLYKIVDLEFRFPNTICVSSDNGKSNMFMPIRFFDGKSIIRDKKINDILK